MDRRAFRAVLLVAWCAAPWALGAEDVVEHVVVRNRLYRVQGRFELSPSLGFMVQSRLTDHQTLSGSAALNVFETIALEARGGLALSRQTGLARSISTRFLTQEPGLDGVRIVDDLADAWQMRGFLLGGIRWAPIYGKLSLLAEVPVHFQAYLWGGGGAGAFHRQSLVDCREVLDRASGSCGDWAQDDKIAWVASAAAGVRFFTHPNGGIKLELRDYAFPDSYRVGIDRVLAEQGQVSGEPAKAGLTHLIMFDLGYTFVF